MSNGKQDKPDKKSEGRALAAMGLDPAEVQAGPAGIHLSEEQAAFVTAFVDHGNKAQAALMTGITEPAAIRAMMANPNVQAAIKAELRLKVLANVVAADAAVERVLTQGGYTGREQIAAAKVAFERAGLLKAAELDAERQAATTGDLSRMSEGELERVIADAAARIAARKPGEGVTLDAETGEPVADT